MARETQPAAAEQPGHLAGVPTATSFFSPPSFSPPSLPTLHPKQIHPLLHQPWGQKSHLRGLMAPAQKPPWALLSCLHPRTCHRRGVTTTCTSTHGGGCREGTAFGPPPRKGSKPHSFGPHHKCLTAVAANVLFIYLFTYLAVN